MRVWRFGPSWGMGYAVMAGELWSQRSAGGQWFGSPVLAVLHTSPLLNVNDVAEQTRGIPKAAFTYGPAALYVVSMYYAIGAGEGRPENRLTRGPLKTASTDELAGL